MLRSFIASFFAFIFLIQQSAFAADPVIRLGNLKLAHFGAISYIKEIAPSCGIKVQETTFAKGLDVMQAVIANELDIGATASEAAISGRAKGVPIYIVAGFAKGGARLVVRPDLGIKTVKDLKGKKVGVTRGSIQEVLLAAELSKNGLTSSDMPGKDVQLVYLAYPDLNQALLQKNVDAINQSEPYGSQAINKGFGVELLKPYNTPIGSPIRTLVMTEKFYKENRATAEKFMLCFVKATDAFIKDKALAEKYVTQTIFQGQITKEDFNDAIGNSPYSFDISPAHIQITTDVMFKEGIGKMDKPPVATDWVKTDLLEKAKKTLNIK
jgi:NitT/TauT family transport system substrate-binding protein